MNKVTAILNGFRRPKNLERQIQSIKNQSVSSDILLWYNHPGEGIDINYDVSTTIASAYCNHNFGVWARFYFAMNAQTEYVCVFDDDTVPGNKWFESCLNWIEKKPGLYGTIGLKYYPIDKKQLRNDYYDPYISLGWKAWPEDKFEPIPVDLVGHAWFFKREWLSYMFRELPDPKYTTCGEDMHFSYMLQKYANLPTYVPPHPTHDMSIWGSIDGARLGADKVSLWESNQVDTNGRPFKLAMNEFFIEQRRKGWKLIRDNVQQ